MELCVVVLVPDLPLLITVSLLIGLESCIATNHKRQNAPKKIKNEPAANNRTTSPTRTCALELSKEHEHEHGNCA